MNDQDASSRQTQAAQPPGGAQVREQPSSLPGDGLYRSMVEAAPDAMLFADLEGRIVLANARAAALYGHVVPQTMIGCCVYDYVAPSERERSRDHVKHVMETRVATKAEYRVRRPDGFGFQAEISLSPLGEADAPEGMVQITRDVSEHVLQDSLREQMIMDLQMALEEIRTLRGIIPICAGCKKIRDDQGFWGQVESYVSKHSHARFSHGMCPDCVRKFLEDDEQRSKST